MKDQVAALFCGAGGFSLGFTKAGMAPGFAADIDEFACATYSANLSTPAQNLDLGSDATSATSKLLEPFRDCFAVVGGPPCQGFSTAGARQINDPRNRLVFNYLQIVDFLRPRWFIFENVEGILTANSGESVYSLLGCFIDRGYTVRLEKVNFASYGLPQSRKRVLIVGNRLGMDFDLPTESYSFIAGKHKSTRPLPSGPSLMDAIGDLPKCSETDRPLAYGSAKPTAYAESLRHSNENSMVTHHFMTKVDHDRVRLLQPGQTMRDLPEEHWHPSFRRRANRRVCDGTPTERRGGAPSGIKRLFAERCCLTITSAASREFIHPNEHRPLTLREAARLQSFPDGFDFQGPPNAIATQIGNAVPPLAAEILARHLAALDGNFGAGLHTHRNVQPGLLGFRLTDASGKSPALSRTESLLRSLPLTGKEAKYFLWQNACEIPALT